MNRPHSYYRGDLLLFIWLLFLKDTRMDNQDQTNEHLEKDGKKIRRQKCEIYTRVMWYIRPISHAKIWKKTEFYSRKYFVEWKTSPRELDIIVDNRNFIDKYWEWDYHAERSMIENTVGV